MTAEARRALVLRTLKDAAQPVSASALAERFGVSRQIIVGDVALLRAEAARAGICEIKQQENVVLLTPYAADLQAVSAACGDPSMRGKLLFSAGKTPLFAADETGDRFLQRRRAACSSFRERSTERTK